MSFAHVTLELFREHIRELFRVLVGQGRHHAAKARRHEERIRASLESTGSEVVVLNVLFLHERECEGFGESCKRFFRFFEFLFAEVGENFLASREAEILHVGHAGDVVVAVFNRLAVDRDDALNASIFEVEVEVTFL